MFNDFRDKIMFLMFNDFRDRRMFLMFNDFSVKNRQLLGMEGLL